ncbi:hypothetical protein H0266_04350 [Halobacillus locisalis]|uniref:Hook-length control protein FliK n=1 Tax=Halobacillus locisalis TaxID=220753 RepID=A0A838CQL6_9BACI|nr:hypothetical protein [Halobacillus locisalis]MBA2174129.1 hypothetical protein [Halobacillus locisalis]
MNPSISSLGKLQNTQQASAAPKVGQVMTGKVVELIPGNRAVVQVGKQQVQAQLETSLTKGKSYVFQVTSSHDGMMQLKVISQQKGTAQRLDVNQLLQGLGMKATKLNVDFLNSLLKTETPFQTADLKQALSILQQSGQKNVAKDVLMQMMQKQYPMKPSVFQAIATKQTTEVTQLLKQLQPVQSPQTMNDQKVANLISHLKGAPPTVSTTQSSMMKVVGEVVTNNPTSFQLFQKAGLINDDASFSRFQQTWNQWAGTKTGTQMPSLQQTQQLLSHARQTPPPLPASIDHIAQGMKRLFDQQLPMPKSEQQSLARWTSQLTRLVDSASTAQSAPKLTESSIQKWAADHQALQQRQTFQKLLPMLSESVRPVMEQVMRQLSQQMEQKTPVATPAMREVAGSLQQIQSSQLTHNQKASLTEWVSRLASDFSPSVKDSILIKLKAMLDLSGVQDESMLKRAVMSEEGMTKEPSLKSSLLQSMQDPQTAIRPETARQMVSLINGIQVSAHQETNQTIQMAMQFPGDMVGATGDIQMNMEGRKTKDGEIDPDFCHVVFFLSLEHFEDTVVDLNIVNRRVGVTVYNHHEVEDVVEEFKPSLVEGLKQVGYQLSTLHVKPIEKQANAIQTPDMSSGDEGVDIRI